MNIDLSEEQAMIKNMARKYLNAEYSGQSLRKNITDEQDFQPEKWRQIAELGWLGLAFPPEYGGEGGNFLDLAVLLEEMGRVSYNGPFFSTVVLGAVPILVAGREKQKKEFLPRIFRGDMLATMALSEADVRYDPEGVHLKAVEKNGVFVLNGVKMFVIDANVADMMICVARTGDKGISMFLVDSKAPGLKVTLFKTVDNSRLCEVIFENVELSADNVLGDMDEAWICVEKILQYAAIAKCAEMLGAAQRILEISIQYCNNRQQFGRPIGAYQSIQHHVANMATDVDGMRLTTYQAAWLLSQGFPCRREVSIAKSWASDAFRRVTLLGLKIHGGVGFMEDHDISVFYQKALTDSIAFGDADFHRDIVFREITCT